MTEIFVRARVSPAKVEDYKLDFSDSLDVKRIYINVTQAIPTISNVPFEEGLAFALVGKKDKKCTPVYDAGIVTRMPDRTLVMEEAVGMSSNGEWVLRLVNQSQFTLSLDVIIYCSGYNLETKRVALRDLSTTVFLAQKTEVPRTKPPAGEDGP